MTQANYIKTIEDINERYSKTDFFDYVIYIAAFFTMAAVLLVVWTRFDQLN